MRALHRRRRLPVVEMTVEPDAAPDLAFATGLTVYDATDLWLARDLSVELVSLDRQLVRAATTH